MICLFILNCKKYGHKRKVQLESWIPLLPPDIPWMHVVGDPGLTSPFTYDQSEHLLTVKCKDTYESLPMKTYLTIQAIFSIYPEVSYVLKTDDDMTCDLDMFRQMLPHLDNKNDYGGEFIEAPAHYSKYHYANVDDEFKKPVLLPHAIYSPGRFYFLSRRLCAHIIQYRPFFESSVFEDYAVGVCSNRLPKCVYKYIEASKIFYEI